MALCFRCITFTVPGIGSVLSVTIRVLLSAAPTCAVLPSGARATYIWPMAKSTLTGRLVVTTSCSKIPQKLLVVTHHPGCAAKDAAQLFLDRAATPPRRGGENSPHHHLGKLVAQSTF